VIRLSVLHPAVRADVPDRTDVTPVRQLSEIVG
jgi:hypothetical protein